MENKNNDMPAKDVARLKELRVIAGSSWGNLMSESMVSELRFLEHMAAVLFARKHGLKLHL